MRALAPALAAAILVAATAACGSGDDTIASAGWETVTDTIGDTVVVRTVGAADSAALLRLVPELQIGELEGGEEYQFAAISAVVPAPDGGMYVWDWGLTALRLYDSSGVFVRQIGGKGGGPGEYESANGLALLPDGRLLLWDPRNVRINVYDSAGTPQESWRAPSTLYTSGGDSFVADTGGNVYVMAWFRSDDTDEPSLPSQNEGYVRLTSDGTVRDTLRRPHVAAPAFDLVASTPDGGATSVYGVPFAPQPFAAFGPLGYFITGVGSDYALTLARPDAPPLRIERDVAAVAVQADERSDAEEWTTAMLRRTVPSWRWNGPAVPDQKPHVRDVLVAADGRILVMRSQPGVRTEPSDTTPPRPGELPPRRWRQPTAYDVFEPDGRFLGFLPVPERTRLLYMRGDTAWGVVTDSLDVPYATRFRLDPSLSSRGAAPI